ncbi:MAG: hypothetical protein IKN55_06135 [Oscillospiraceae bacterium]|nr:hypothetical protein [Oscillospiraceae bacterium]
MATNEKMLCIGNDEIPESWTAQASYALVQTNLPYLLIVSDRPDGTLEMHLFRRKEREAVFVAHRKLPLSVDHRIAEKMTGALIQQMQLRRKMGNGTAQSILRDFESIFRKSDARTALFQKLSGFFAQENAIRFAAVNETIGQIVQTCEFDFSNYAPFFRQPPVQNTMLHLFNGMFMEWNGLMQLVHDFLTEQTLWMEDARCDLQVVMCGSLLKLACLSEPGMGNVNSMLFTPSHGQLLYKMSYEMLRNEAHALFKFYLTVNNAPYAAILLEAYHKQAVQKQRAAVPATIRVFSEKLLALPEDAGIYAGHTGGRKIPLNGILLHHDADGGRLLTAPFTQEFSALVAEGSVTFYALDWEKQEEGWQITVRYSYNGKQYSLRPKLYREEQITQIGTFPDLVMYKAADSPEMYLSCSGGDVHVEVYGGRKTAGRTCLDSRSGSTYLRVYREGYLGQFDYRVKKNGGGQHG